MSTESSTISSSRSEGGPSVAVLSWVGAWFIRLLRRTVRISYHGEETIREWEREGRRFILAFWHRHLLLMRYAYRGERMVVLISQSKDGELIARTMAHLGIGAARGSSSRGGVVGMRSLLRKAREGWDLTFTPDGPRGPASVVQPGVVLAAAATGLPIVPVALAASRCRRLSSWDRFLVPLPGCRVPVVYGEPLEVGRRDDLEAAALELGRRLLEAEENAEERAARRGRDR